MDPSSVVREGEMASAPLLPDLYDPASTVRPQEGQGILQQLLMKLLQAQLGGGDTLSSGQSPLHQANLTKGPVL